MILLSLVFVINAILLYVAIPFILGQFPWLSRYLIFKTKDVLGFNEENYQFFQGVELSCKSSRNFYVESWDTNDRLGVWHILPYEAEVATQLDSTQNDATAFEISLAHGEPVFIYFHGNSKSRATPWRVNIYKLLSSLGYHVIAFDYRGYGDSTGSMTSEQDCVYDCLAVLDYVYTHCGDAPVFFWGHSLGTGIVGALVRHLLNEGTTVQPQVRLPKGIILDAPFTNLVQAVVSARSMLPYRYVPYWHRRFASIASRQNIEFHTESNLANCSIPIMILHAEDDYLVPFRQGEKLALTLGAHPENKVHFVRFGKNRGYKHNFIHTAPEMPELLRSFVRSVMNGEPLPTTPTAL
ncbi:Abhydrolase domain-containing protein 12 [Fasciola hepatica]|uniref:Abhydrolase domain-containing protein 12 n=1 Tax=Fasciola hepatica TaxID=6192 RepID=A0A4E0RAI9_FASHE|nr:Abhydrolase domain-containing protein 12 [Fasciola hepatica]